MGKNYSKRFLYNMYRARCKPAPQIQNTTIFKKPTGKETGPWLHPTRVWQGTLRLKFRVILLGVVTRVRWGEVSTPAVLRMKGKSQHCPPRRREAEGRREAAWGPAKRPETASFLDGLRTQLEQEHKTWRKGLQARGVPLGQESLRLSGGGLRVLESSPCRALCLLTALRLHGPHSRSQDPAFTWSLLALWSQIPLCSLGWCLPVYLALNLEGQGQERRRTKG